MALLALTRALYVTQEELLFCGVINLFAFLASPAALSYPGDSFIHVLQFRATLRNLMLLSVRVYHYPRLHAFFFISLLIRGCQHIMLWLHFTYCSRTKDGWRYNSEWALAFRAHPILQLVEEIANENTISIQIPKTFNLLVHSANRPDYIAQTCNIDISRLLLLYFTCLLFKPPRLLPPRDTH